MSDPNPNLTLFPYPRLQAAVLPDISAQSAIIMDADTKVILYAKNIHDRHLLASTTKIMTALTAIEKYRLQDTLTVFNPNIEGSVVGFYAQEKVAFENLLYGMLLPSGNDAAYAIAENYPGGEQAFIQAMNATAQAFHLLGTHYQDPAGLLEEGNYTTAEDLARLSAIVLKNPEIKKVVGTSHAFITSADGKTQYELFNLNKLLGTDHVIGIKTGYTEKAGQVLVTATEKDGHTIIIVIMKSDDRFFDTEKLLSVIDQKITFESTYQ